ncbi:cysteine proteinase [Tothia fuscella]|uniref:Ubiquitin carboxyl-terminal hydrolase n=1 Tax=Tothia fuscella TaxID=1048955 RepID=A0A9P4P1V5_9PEZI|nr:cysteine proteinase [Tothia fuscella]
MASFFGRLKGANNPAGTSAGSTPAKKDPNAPQPTPLEKLLIDAGPIRTDGSDKFFGFENFGSTCYCNSIVQCLYYSAPFREQVINFPVRSPHESLKRKSAAISSNEDTTTQLTSPVKSKNPFATSLTQSSSPRTKQVPATTTASTAGQPKQEENKESPEYKKKVALATGPVLAMNYENSNAYGMDGSLFSSLKDIFEAVIANESRIGVVSPTKLLEILKRDNEMFRTPMHQDAHEFLNLLLNQIVENVEQYSKENEASSAIKGASNSLVKALSPVIPSSILAPPTGSLVQNSRWVHELFEGTLTSETRCLTCENISQRDEAFLDLSVDLDHHSSVTSCLRRFSEEEMLCERNKFHCDKCGGLQEAEKRMKVKRLPRILALHLKRFKYTEDMQRLAKLFHRVVYPFYLRLFNTTDEAEDPDRLYELYAVVVHIGGGPYHGHYVSIIKTQDRGWLLFDDEMVEPVDKRFVLNFFGEGVNENGHPKNLACAYVLFYQETTFEAMERELASEGVSAMPEAQKDPIFNQPKANGVAVPNGVHQANFPTTPMSEEVEGFASLDRETTTPLPPPPTAPGPFHNPLEPIQTSPTIPFLKRKKSFAKKEQERHEKEERERRKAEEKEQERQIKELEKAAKIKKKEMDAIRKENQKRQEEELAARYKAAGKPSSNASSSQAGDDSSYTSIGTGTTGNRGSGLGMAGGLGIHEDTHMQTLNHAQTPPPQQTLQPPPTSHPNPNQNGFSSSSMGTTPNGVKDSGSMLHRFRNTSMSLRQKPKFWGKDRERKGKNSGDHSDLSREGFLNNSSHDSQSPSETTESSTNATTPSAGYGSPELSGMKNITGPSTTSVLPPITAPVPLAPTSTPVFDKVFSKGHGDKPVKKESRFGLGRKKSVNLL